MKMFKKGFTLIELLVVIAIIGILATIVIVNLTSAQRGARFNAARENAISAAKAAAVCTSSSTLATPSTFPTGLVAPSTAGTNLCTDTALGLGAWPSLGAGNGWTYTALTGADQNFSFTASGPNAAGTATTLTCNFQGCS